MKRLGIDPASLDAVVLSHPHGDHTAGLERFLRQNSKVKVHLPQSFQQQLQRLGADTMTINGPVQLCDRVHSTGEMGASPSEIEQRLEALRALGVKKVAPSHCTGEAAINRLLQHWRGDFIAGGCGAVIEIYP